MLGMRWLDDITNSMDMNLSKLQETVKKRGAWHAAVHGIAKNWTRLSEQQQQQTRETVRGGLLVIKAGDSLRNYP